jgi:hypothetical protein
MAGLPFEITFEDIFMKKIALAIALTVAASSASAATYTLTSATTTNLFGATALDVLGGSADVTGGAVTITGADVQYVSATAGFDFNYDATATVGGDAVIKGTESCANTGAQDACGANLGNWVIGPYGNDNAISAVSITEAAGILTVSYDYNFFGGTTNQEYVFTQAVPVPAAAWLFGSALLGLVGVGRRRTKA